MDTLERIKKTLVCVGNQKKPSSDTQPKAYNCAFAITLTLRLLMKAAFGDFCSDKDEGSDSIKINIISIIYTRNPNKILFPVGEFRAKLKLKGKRRLVLCIR